MLTKYTYTKQVTASLLGLEISKSSITIALDHIETSAYNCDIWFKSELSNAEITELDTLVESHEGSISTNEQPLNYEGTPIVELSLRKGRTGINHESFTIVTHDFTDPSSWYQFATQETTLVLTNLGDNINYQAPSGKRSWVNINSPKLTIEHNKILEKDGTLASHSKYTVSVLVNDIESTIYSIDYSLGKITFDTALNPGDTVKASFYYNEGVSCASCFVIQPPVGYKYSVEHVELQMSKNLNYNDIISFEIWAGGSLGDYGSFEDYLYDAGYGQGKTHYRNTRDLINWCNNQYPVIPACGDLTHDILVFPFRFLITPEIKSSQGVLLLLHLVNNTPLSGEIATATLYMEKLQDV